MKYILALVILNVFVAFGQNEDVVLFFRAEEFNKNVLLNWTISEGNTCNGIDVYRSLDGVNFSIIGDIEGICGSGTEPIDYSFTDIFPETNGSNYYRLSLGGLGYSYIIKINLIDIPINSYLIVPQPITASSQLFFNNDLSKSAELKIYNYLGELIFAGTTNTAKFELGSLLNEQSGIYQFTIDVNGRELNGKINIP